MSRIIKFRIWDNDKSEWLGASDSNVVTYYGFHLVGEVMTAQAPPVWALDRRCVVEQYTGLKDKNGKEIYEKDIVSSHNGDVLSQIVQSPSGEYMMCHVGTYGGKCSLYPELQFVEVVGNIHETPGLLVERRR